MGTKISINNILRQDIQEKLEVGKEYQFQKNGLYLLLDDIQIWLTKPDWTVLADIQITSQTRENNITTGRYIVKYLYKDQEQQTLTDIFRRMYGWE